MSRIMTCLGFLLLFALNPPEHAEAQNVGDAVPTFSLTGLDGKTYASSYYRGSVLVLYYLGHS